MDFDPALDHSIGNQSLAWIRLLTIIVIQICIRLLTRTGSQIWIHISDPDLDPDPVPGHDKDPDFDQDKALDNISDLGPDLIGSDPAFDSTTDLGPEIQIFNRRD